MAHDWKPFIDNTTGNPPRALYLDAVERFDSPGTVADLGFGAGNETVDLLRRGWRVHAVDSHPAAADILRDRASTMAGQLTVTTAVLSEFEIPGTDFIHAGFSLFFTEPDSFIPLWSRIVDSLRPGGRFAGQLLGERDTWAAWPHVTAHTRPQLDHLLRGLDVERLTEVEEDGRAMTGPKHWHIWEIIARRP